MVELIHQCKRLKDKLEELEIITTLIDDAESVEELVSIEMMIGISELLGDDMDYLQISGILSMVESPYAFTYQALGERWIDIE